MRKHTPVLLTESVSSLAIQQGGIYVDCTFGSGGHSEQILRTLAGTGKLVSFDCDYSNLQWAERLRADNFLFIHDNFANFRLHLDSLGIEKVDGFLFDLGLSSMQLDSERGFSYRHDSPLDMRMNHDGRITAADIVNNFSLDEIAGILYHFGQERKAYKVARALLNHRKKSRIESAQELVRITAGVIGKQKGRAHPSKRVFQALRIRVNGELDNLRTALSFSLDYLSEKGRIVIISYHSLEDSIVKKFFRSVPRQSFLYGKPLSPTREEVIKNNRARSAKLRVLVRGSGKTTNRS